MTKHPILSFLFISYCLIEVFFIIIPQVFAYQPPSEKDEIRKYRIILESQKKNRSFSGRQSFYTYDNDTIKNLKLKELSINSTFELFEKEFINNNENMPLMVYEILLYFGSNRQDASEILNQIYNLKLDTEKAYMIYEQPNYKVRLGKYYSKLQAYHRLNDLKAIYNSASITQQSYHVNWDSVSVR